MPAGICATCGNEYDKAFEVTAPDDERYLFDSLECAAQALAPTCAHCGTRILGHGVESDDRIFCCAHCAAEEGVRGLADRV